MAQQPTGIRYYYRYYPPGVKEILASGTCAWIGEVDESTVLKYPKDPRGGDDREMWLRLEAERKMLEVLSPHPRIIGLRGSCDAGIYLERAVNGTVADYILKAESDKPSISIQERLAWCRETAEAVVYIHSKRVLHCDLQPTNLLLDEKLHIKLADFQGQQLSEDGVIIVDGWRGEPCRYYCPRDPPRDADYKTDLFALGSNIYFIMMDHEVFPDIIYGSHCWHEQVEERFAQQQFPEDEHACGAITAKCWRQQYDSAKEVLRDILAVEERLAASETSGMIEGLKAGD